MGERPITTSIESSNNHELLNGCQHHWFIEPPNGPVSSGQCKNCGAEREFRNSTTSEDYIRQGQTSRALAIELARRGMIRTQAINEAARVIDNGGVLDAELLR